MRRREMLRRNVLALAAIISIAACGGSTSNEIDCDVCADDEVCWYTTNVEGSTSDSGCLSLPAACVDDQSCDCINSEPASTCEQVGFEQNSNACSVVDDAPLVYCVSTLG